MSGIAKKNLNATPIQIVIGDRGEIEHEYMDSDDPQEEDDGVEDELIESGDESTARLSTTALFSGTREEEEEGPGAFPPGIFQGANPQFRESEVKSEKEYFVLEAEADREKRESEEYKKEGIGGPDFNCEICRIIRFKFDESNTKHMNSITDMWDIYRLQCPEDWIFKEMAKKFNRTIYAFQLKNKNPYKLKEWTHVMLRWHYSYCDTARSMMKNLYRQYMRLQSLSDVLYNEHTFYRNVRKEEVRNAKHPDRTGRRYNVDFLDDGEYDLPNKKQKVETHEDSGVKMIQTTDKNVEVDLKTMAMLQKTIKQELELMSCFQRIDPLFGMGSTFGNIGPNNPGSQVVQDRMKRMNQSSIHSHMFPVHANRTASNMTSLNRITSGASSRVTESNVNASQRLASMIHNK